MPIFLYFCLDVPWHGDVNSSVDIIPIEGYPAIQVSCPILCQCVRCLQACNQVLDIVVIDVLDSEVIDHKYEQNWASVMVPKARRVHAFMVSEWGQFPSKLLVGQYS